MTLKRTIELLKEYLKMNTANKYRLDEINKIRDYFNNEIKERKDIIKKLSKYLVIFDYLDKIFITLSASFGKLSIASYASVVGIPAGITSASLTLVFTIGTGISKSLLKLTEKRKKKHNKIIVLAKNKLNTIDTLRQPRFVYSACGPFTRHKERIKEFKLTGDTRYIYRNELDKACFQHDSAYADHKDLINRTEADKVLKDKAYDIASNPEYDGYQRGLASMVYKFFDKKSAGSGFKKLKNTTKPSSSILADELHKPVIRKFKKRKVYSQFKDNIWGVDLPNMQSLSRKNKGIKYLLCAIDLYSK